VRVYFGEAPTPDSNFFGLGSLEGVPPAMQVAVHQIPGGDRGTKATLDRMRKLVIESIKDPKHGAFLRGLAIKITLDAGCKTKQYMCEAKALADWVRDNVKWIRDTRGFETLQYPYRTLGFGAGDCDDLSILLASLSISIGIPTQFRAIAANPMRKDQYSHVYVIMDPTQSGKWISADPTVKTANFGWESPLKYKVMDLEI
jgi:hypothetical protein